jgi:ankyrin repeat protein
VIKTLLHLYPDAVRIQDSKDGSLPLHKLVVHKSHWIHDGIRDVYLANKDAIRTGDFQGRLPLHRAAAANQAGGGPGGSVILQLMEECPETAAIADGSGRLALHYIAEFGETWEEEAEAVYRAHEPAIRVRAGAEQRLPIHLAAASPDARRSMLETLVEMHPRGARQADRTGKLPLHLACESGKRWSKGIGDYRSLSRCHSGDM